MRGGNLHRRIPAALPDELVSKLAGSGSVRIERIVSRGHASEPNFWYDQVEAEFVLLVSGAAELEFADGERHELRPGDWLEIPARRRHRVAWTAPDTNTVWLAVFFPDAKPSEDP